MSRIGAEFYIEVHGILAEPAVLGSSLTVDRNDVKLRIDLPSAEDAFDFVYASGLSQGDPREYSPKKALLKQSESLVDIRLLRVVANVDLPLSVETYNPSSDRDKGLHDDLLRDLRKKAVDLVAEFCDRLRLELDQHWIEPTGTYPRVVNMAALVDIDAQKGFQHLLGLAGKIRIVDESSVVGEGSLPRLRDKLKAGPLRADELLLAEAVFLANADQPVGPDRATVVAAMAVELRIKRLLRELAEPDLSDVLDLLISKPRDWSLSVHDLFREAVPVFLRQGPATEVHKSLAKKVQTLFTERNWVIHRGWPVDRGKASEHVRTAREVFDYMDRLVEDRS